MELALLPGKSVVSDEGKNLGYVLRVYVGKDLKVAALSCADPEEDEFVLPAAAILAVGDAVVAGPARQKELCGTPCPVGLAAFDKEGRFLGHCCSCDTKGGLSVAEKEGVKQYPFAKTTFGDIVLIGEKKSARVRKKSAPSAQNEKRVAKTETKNETPAAANLSGGAPKEEFGLLGKQVKKAVADVAAQGETVTPETLKRARENNKLLELRANTLTE